MSGRFHISWTAAFAIGLMAIGFISIGVAFISAMSYAVNGTELVYSTVLLACFGSMPLIVGAIVLDEMMEKEDG